MYTENKSESHHTIIVPAPSEIGLVLEILRPHCFALDRYQSAHNSQNCVLPTSGANLAVMSCRGRQNAVISNPLASHVSFIWIARKYSTSLLQQSNVVGRCFSSHTPTLERSSMARFHPSDLTFQSRIVTPRPHDVRGIWWCPINPAVPVVRCRTPAPWLWRTKEEGVYNAAVADIPAFNDISNEKLMRRDGDFWVRMLESCGREVGLPCVTACVRGG